MMVTSKASRISKQTKRSRLIKPLSLAKGTCLAAIMLSWGVQAETYNSFTSIGYSSDSYVIGYKAKTKSIATSYFFEGRETRGPLNEFDYINTSSNVQASYTDTEIEVGSIDHLSDSLLLAGQWFVNDFVLGASYSRSESGFDIQPGYISKDDIYSASLGYLITEDWIFDVQYTDYDDLYWEYDTIVRFSTNYNLALNDSDYLGFGYASDEDFDVHTLTVKYFVNITGQSYLAFNGLYAIDDTDGYMSDDNWKMGVSYYFNDRSSVSASFDDHDIYTLAVGYYFNDNFSVQAYYSATNDTPRTYEIEDSLGVRFFVQF